MNTLGQNKWSAKWCDEKGHMCSIRIKIQNAPLKLEIRALITAVTVEKQMTPWAVILSGYISTEPRQGK